MSITIQDENGNDVSVNATFDGGSLRCMVRAPDRATFEAVALSVGLTKEDEGGSVRDVPGITIARLGPHVITPGTYDADGNEMTAPVVDGRFHANFWLPPRVVEGGLWKQWAIAWTQNGTAVQDKNKSEEGLEFNNVELLDPATIASPSNVLAGF